MGRKLVEAGAVPDPTLTTTNIDSLKELFNVLGAQVTEARGNLEKALEVSDSLMTRVAEVMTWLEEAELELGEAKGKVEAGLLEAKVGQMRQMKVKVRELLAVKAEFLSLASDPSLLRGLSELMAGLETRWSKVKGLLEEELSESNEAEEVELPELVLDKLDNKSTSSLAGVESREVLEQAEEEGAVLHEFREVFQEVAGWLDSAEKQLERARRASEDRQLEEQVVLLRPKVESLGTMAVRVAEQYSSQREDVHGEMVSLGGRWEAVVSKIEPGFSLVEVEQIKTTISQLVIPPAALVQATSVPDKEEIMTLAEEQLPDLEEQVTSSPQKETSRSSSKEKSKSPPPTLPKPRWYVESMQAKRNGNTPVRQVDKRYSVQAI